MACGVRAHRTRTGARRYFVKIGYERADRPGSYRRLDTGLAFYSTESAWAFAARLMQRIDGPDAVDIHRMS